LQTILTVKEFGTPNSRVRSFAEGCARRFDSWLLWYSDDDIRGVARA
jgi:hypothetical protein